MRGSVRRVPASCGWAISRLYLGYISSAHHPVRGPARRLRYLRQEELLFQIAEEVLARRALVYSVKASIAEAWSAIREGRDDPSRRAAIVQAYARLGDARDRLAPSVLPVGCSAELRGRAIKRGGRAAAFPSVHPPRATPRGTPRTTGTIVC